jgi:hypothetical protein
MVGIDQTEICAVWQKLAKIPRQCAVIATDPTFFEDLTKERMIL